MKWLDAPPARVATLLASLGSLVVVLLGEPQCAAALARLALPLGL